MTSHSRPRQLAALIAACVLAGTACAAAPPVPEQALLAAIRAAGGGAHWQQVSTLDLHARVQVAGLDGTRELRADRHGRFVRVDRVGLAGESRGFDGMHAWTRDEKSLVTRIDGARGRPDSISDGYVLSQGWRYPASEPATLRVIGRRSEHGRAFDVVEATPRGGTPLTLWFDADSHLLARAGRDDQNGARHITRFADYRTVDGLRLPFRISVGTPEQPTQTVVTVERASLHRHDDARAFRMPASAVHDAHIVGGGFATTVPFEDYAGLMLVRASINGGPPLPFILDSGGLNVLTPAAARRLGLKGEGKQVVYGVGPGTATMALTRVRSLALGQARLDDQRFYILPLPPMVTDRGDREPIAGIIGYEVYRRFVARIDYDRDRLTLTLPAHFDATGAGHALRLRFDGRTPQVRAQVDGRSGLFLLDTGNAGALQLTAAFADRWKIGFSGTSSASVDAGVGGHSASRSGRIDRLQLAGHVLRRPRATISAARSGVLSSSVLAGNIGYDVLSQFRVTLDYPHRRMYLTPGARFGRAAAPRGSSGMAAMRVDHAHLQVVAVNAGSPAARAGIKRGDRIDRVDDTAVRHLDLATIRAHLRGRPGGRLRLHVIDAAGHARDVTLRLESGH